MTSDEGGTSEGSHPAARRDSPWSVTVPKCSRALQSIQSPKLAEQKKADIPHGLIPAWSRSAVLEE